MFTRKPLSTVIMLVMALSLAGCSEPEQAAADNRLSSTPRPAMIETISSRYVAPDFAYIGTVRAAQKAELSFELSGKLVSIKVKEGDFVEKGQVIAELDKQQLQNNYQSSLTEFKKAEKDTQRLETLYEANRAIALSDLEQSRTQRDILKNRLDNEQRLLENATLRAPFAGIIARQLVDEFNFVQAKETIFSLKNLDDLEVEFNIPGSVVLTSTDEVRSVVVFDQLPDLKLPVKFKYIITEGDHTTQTYRVIFSLPKTDQANILPGMSVTIIPDAEAPVENKQRSILIPLKSIISDNSGNKFSWKVAVDGTVTRTKIETGALIGDKVRIVSGLTRGDQIVTTGVNSLRDGMKVRPLGLE